MRTTRPQVVLIENVKGLSREAFRPYLEYIVLQMRYPTITQRPDEGWRDHAARLWKITAERAHVDLEYHVTPPHVVNLADYGVPQKRERLFIVALRSDVNIEWNFPSPTHSREALICEQWLTSTYWERHSLLRPDQPNVTAGLLARIERNGVLANTAPWHTVRDALHDLPEPIDERGHATILNHVGIPGARAYKGHEGSLYDEPAKTLKAGGHGVPGGENMLLRDNGTLRYFTVRESARLQTFPDNYVFSGSRSEAMRQIGNAVPVVMAELLARKLQALLIEFNARRKQSKAVPTAETIPLLSVVGS
jgi:DNA (cytosine-5)-methyltransferase 1